MKAMWPALAVVVCFAQVTSASGVWGSGENDYLTLSDHADLTLPDGDWALSMWVKGDNSGTGTRWLLMWGDRNANPGLAIWLNRGSTYPQHDLGLEINNQGDKSTTSDPGNTADWFHLIVTRSSNELLLYVDGTAQISGVNATFYGAVDVAAGLYVGNYSTPEASASWAGKIAEIAKWDDDLTANQREALVGLDEYAGDPQAPNSAAVDKAPTWYLSFASSVSAVDIGSFSITNNGVVADADDHPFGVATDSYSGRGPGRGVGRGIGR